MQFSGLAARRTGGKSAGDAAEDAALHHLRQAGLLLLTRNYRTPGRGGGEIDLVMQDADGTLVFVEVRARRCSTHGGAAASIGAFKRARIVFAARHYLARLAAVPPCRFDVVLMDGASLRWFRAAFDAA